MLIKVKFVNSRCQIRTSYSLSSTVINTVGRDETQYSAIKSNNGFLYIDELKGWAERDDLYIVQVVEDFNPDTDSDFSNSTNLSDNPGDQLSAIDIINLINKCTSGKIDSTKIKFLYNNVEYTVDQYMKLMSNKNDEIDESLGQIAALTKLPKPTSDDAGKVIKVGSDGILILANVSYDEIVGEKFNMKNICEDEF